MSIRRIRAAGLSLEEISGVLDILVAPDADPSSAETPELLEQRLNMVRTHLEHVRNVERTLMDLLEIRRAMPTGDWSPVAVDEAETGRDA